MQAAVVGREFLSAAMVDDEPDRGDVIQRELIDDCMGRLDGGLCAEGAWVRLPFVHVDQHEPAARDAVGLHVEGRAVHPFGRWRFGIRQVDRRERRNVCGTPSSSTVKSAAVSLRTGFGFVEHGHVEQDEIRGRPELRSRRRLLALAGADGGACRGEHGDNDEAVGSHGPRCRYLDS
jgi:hypothetical protein